MISFTQKMTLSLGLAYLCSQCKKHIKLLLVILSCCLIQNAIVAQCSTQIANLSLQGQTIEFNNWEISNGGYWLSFEATSSRMNIILKNVYDSKLKMYAGKECAANDNIIVHKHWNRDNTAHYSFNTLKPGSQYSIMVSPNGINNESKILVMSQGQKKVKSTSTRGERCIIGEEVIAETAPVKEVTFDEKRSVENNLTSAKKPIKLTRILTEAQLQDRIQNLTQKIADMEYDSCTSPEDLQKMRSTLRIWERKLLDLQK